MLVTYSFIPLSYYHTLLFHLGNSILRIYNFFLYENLMKELILNNYLYPLLLK